MICFILALNSVLCKGIRWTFDGSELFNSEIIVQMITVERKSWSYPNTYLTGLHTYIIDPVCRPHLHSLIESPPYLPTSSTYLAYLRTECKTVVEMVARMNASVAWDLGVA